MSNFVIHIAQHDLLEKVVLFYKSVGEDVILDSSTVLVAMVDGRIVGAVRLVEEFDVLVLRTMNVDPQFQRQGVGTALLQKATVLIADRVCYCLPYPHVKAFYEKFDFIEVEPATLPDHLRERYREYTESFAVIAMQKE